MSRSNLGTIDPNTMSGTTLATELTDFEQALLSQHADGTGTRPSYAIAKSIWVNDSVTPWVVNMYDGTDDIVIGTVNATTNKFIPGASAAAVFTDIKQAASTTATGVVELATQVEVDDDTGTNVAVTSTTFNSWVSNVLGSTTVDDTEGGFNLVSYPPKTGEVGVVNYQYEYGDVRRYGAVGDGVTDDTAAIQAAIDYAGTAGGGDTAALDRPLQYNQKTVYLSTPSVHYLVTSTLTLGLATNISGDGRNSIIRFIPTVTGTACIMSHSLPRGHLFLRDFVIQGAGRYETEGSDVGEDNAIGIFLHGSFIRMDNIGIANFHEGIGLELGNCYRGLFTGIHIDDCATGLKLGDDTLNYSTNSNTFVGGSIRNCGEKTDAITSGSDAQKYTYLKNNSSVVFSYAENIKIEGMTFENNYAGISLVIRAANIDFNNIWDEANCKLLDPNNTNKISVISDFESLFSHFLYAESSTAPILLDGTVSISNFTVKNSQITARTGVACWADSTHEIQGIVLDGCYTAVSSNYTVIKNGYVHGVEIRNMSRKQYSYDEYTKTVTPPKVRTTSASGSYPDDPVIYHSVGGRLIPATVEQWTLVAGTEGFVFDAIAATHIADVYINFDNTMNATAINNKIISLKHDLHGGIIYRFIFADGTYNLTSSLVFSDFSGAGEVIITGNESEGGLHSNQAVVIDDSATNIHCLRIDNNTCTKVTVRNVRVKSNSLGGEYFPFIYNINGYIEILGCYLEGNSAAAASAIELFKCPNVYMRDNYINNINKGIFARWQTVVFSYNNRQDAIQPAYGLKSEAAHIYKRGTQSTGSTAAEITAYGGAIT